MSCDSLLFIGVQGLVHVVLKSSGQHVWSAKTGVPLPWIKHPITIVQPHPPTASLLVSSGPNLRCLAATTGDLIWENKLGNLKSGLSMVALEPSTYPNTVPAAATGVDDDAHSRDLSDYVFVAGNWAVRALRLSDGTDRWEFKTPLNASCSSLPAMLIEDGVLFLSGNRHVWAIDATTGKEMWCTKLPSGDSWHCLSTMRSSALCRPVRFDPSSPSPYVVQKTPTEGLLFAGLSSVDINNGNIVYVHPEPVPPTFGPVKGPLIPDPEIIPLPSSNTAIVSYGINVRRVSLNDARNVWENELRGMGFGALTMLVGGGVVVAGSDMHNSPPSYKAAIVGSPFDEVHYSDRVFVAACDRLFSISISKGETLWECKLSFFNPRGLRPPFVLPEGDGRVYVSANGYIRCVDADSGEQMWQSHQIETSFSSLASYGSGNGETNRTSVFHPIYWRKFQHEYQLSHEPW
ncbi:hypothetical protein BJ742DRAFT_781394 [Cladochytrium replicatum]|nr:hypothetical protein BJ742DRAFT_781394 [Cladochytrium replicatum]